MTGYIEGMTKKDYMTGMMEKLCRFYDGRSESRRLAKEEIKVKDPAFNILAGGTWGRFCHVSDLKHVYSGFYPRFIFSIAGMEERRMSSLGPPSDSSIEEEDSLLRYLASLRDNYGSPTFQHVGLSMRVQDPEPTYVELDQEVWDRLNRLKDRCGNIADTFPDHDTAAPMFDRLAESILRVSVLLAVDRTQSGPVTVTLDDFVQSMKYGQDWMDGAAQVVMSIGKSEKEELLERVYLYISNINGTTRAKVMQKFKIFKQDMDELESTMQQRGLVVLTKTPKGRVYVPK